KTIFMHTTIKSTIAGALLCAALIISGSSCKYVPPTTPPPAKNTLLEKVASDSRFTYLSVAVVRAGLSGTLSDKNASLTLFAPTDAAFWAAGFASAEAVAQAPIETLKAILLYHVLPSEVKSSSIPLAANTEVNTVANKPVYVTRTSNNKVFVNGVSVIQKDWDAKNGVIHVIDRVLIPAVGTIVATAQGNAQLSYLVAAVLRASQGSTNVAAVLSGAGPLTVFAPTNQAFINAGFATIDAINAADPAALTTILTYHVIAGRVFSSDLVNGAKVPTVNGGTVEIQLNGGARVKGKSNTSASNILITDIVASNGVVHVIDQVLLP
ncbi:MAG TPA: fasciclin domain-containing protein, partial [Chitinophagaceae bacterium]|nr:fasciclin domain-containing protein [Chitinophagaceae bacterium]